MDYLLLVVATAASSGKAIFCKLCGSAKGRDSFLVNFKSFLVAFLVALAFAARDLKNLSDISLFSLLLAIGFGFSVGFTQFTQMKAMATGPASITTLIYSSSFLIPIIFASIVWSEPVSVWQLVGVGILLVSLFLIVFERGGGRANAVWLVFIALATLGSGANAIIQKTHQKSDYSDELNLFLVLALLFSALFSLAMYFISRPSEDCEVKEKKASLGSSILFPLVLGASVGCLNFLNLKLAGKLPSVVHFPVLNVGSLILTSVISIVCFKERLSPRRIVGFILGVGAILLIGLT